MNFTENLKNKYKKAKENQNAFQKDPSSAAAKQAARTGGVVMTILGLALLVANYITWTTQGSVLKLALAAMLVLLVLGPWTLITGKFPIKKKQA